MKRALGRILLVAGGLGLLSGCDNMQHQRNAVRTAGPVVNPPPAHTVATDDPDPTEPLVSGYRDGRPLARVPLRITAAVLQRGRERFAVNCTPCHGEDGYGAGIVVRRGFPAPPSFHQERLREVEDGHIFEVITRGYGMMLPFGDRISPEDRWTIVAYVRALQRSQWESLAALPAEDRARFEKR